MISGVDDLRGGRRLRLGMVGGGPGGFIGAVHRAAARLDDRYDIVATALSSNPDKSLNSARDLRIPRAYSNFEDMAREEAKRADRIDVVSIVTPNNLHYQIANAFLTAGIHVFCEKPLTTSLGNALDLAKKVEESGLLFALAYTYTGYPMVRQAREMVLAGELGPLRLIQVEYVQDWLSIPLENTGQKQADWRTDPVRSGPGGCLGDLATHAFHLTSFASGLECEEIAADVTTFVPGRKLDDNAQLLLRFSGGAKGSLWASQVAPGNENSLRLRMYGERAGLSWTQEEPNRLSFTPLGEAPRLITRASTSAGPAASYATRIPAGHPEGYFEAFAQLYSDLAEQIMARLQQRQPDPRSLLVPGIAEGVRGIQFVNTALDSSRRGSVWCSMKK